MPLTFEQAYEQQDLYRSTDSDTLARLARITIAAFAGPSAAGKNFQMRQSGYTVTGTITTRARRDNDVGYRYIDTSTMLQSIERGTLVQYAAIPQLGTIYGTDIQDYPTNGVYVMDVIIRGIDVLRQKGFGVVRPIGVVAYPEDWETRLDGRFAGMDQDFIRGRLEEAEDCLVNMLEVWAHRDDHLLVVSSEDHNPGNPKRVRDFIQTGIASDNREAQKVARDMLAKIPELREKYLTEES